MEGDAGVEQKYLEPEKTYSGKRKEWLSIHKKLKKRSRLLGWLRLTIFVVAFTFPFIFFELFSQPFLITFTIPIILFAWLVKYAGKIGEDIRYASYMVEINTIEIDALNYNFENLPEGDEFIDPQHDFAHDLDIFGKGSLFQFINRTATQGGLESLAGKLTNPIRESELIKKRQKVVEELAGRLKFRHSFYSWGKMVNEDKQQKDSLENISKIDLAFFGNKETALSIVFPLMAIAVTLSVAFGYLPAKALIYIFFTGLGLSGIYFKRITKVHKQLSHLGDVLSGYSKLFRLVESENFEASQLIRLQERLKSSSNSASGIICKLGKRINLLDQRLNMFLGPVLNGFFLLDLLVVRSLKKMLNSDDIVIPQWFSVMHELDALNSLAGFGYNHPAFVYPGFFESGAVDAKDLGHPLIPGNERVNNLFSISGDTKIVIVTGANMAGKSTFLRTVGVNLVLAGTGAKVCASEFSYYPMRLITSMRAIDSLYKHESYFFSELKRLKYIVDEIKRGEQLFFILDEILKGTNSHDKTKGSIALTEQLLKLGAAGIIATHDLELGKLSNLFPGKIVNNCFEVEFDKGKLLFDYILREGVTTSHNATYLMKNMGLI